MGNISCGSTQTSLLELNCNNRAIEQPQSFSNQEIESEECCDSPLITRVSREATEIVVASKNIMNWRRHNTLIALPVKEEESMVSFPKRTKTDLVKSTKDGSLNQVTKITNKIRIKKPTYLMIQIDPKQFIVVKGKSIHQDYELQEQIGKGSYGVVYKARSIQQGEIRAIKKISKQQMTNQQKINLINQFEILKRLDHPHIIKLYDIYQDQLYYYVVTELCEGGNMLQFVNRNKANSELIHTVMQQLISSVKYLHSLNILHRDLKLQNIVIVQKFTDKQNFAILQIKIIDFGVSLDLNTITDFKTSQIQGTFMYMAPQCIKGQISLASDMWSCGIICYLMATKKYPYQFAGQNQLANKIKKAKFDRKSLQKVDPQIKLLIVLLLEKDKNQRITAEECLNSKWLKKRRGSFLTQSTKNKVANNILSYNAKNNLVSMIESYLVCKRINQVQRQRLATIFVEIDSNKSGLIEVQQFKQFYFDNCDQYDEAELQDLLHIIDKNKSGKIDFNEFISAMYSRRKLFHEQSLSEAFDFFDKDNSGKLSRKQVHLILQGIQDEQVEYLFQQLDSNKDEKISKQQFIQYLIRSDSDDHIKPSLRDIINYICK